ncbi:phage tail-collar fiber domain-containing protein [Grimontia marina]|uniref:Tail fiber protein n=1 Tax=Grimontia marina TaxID=646534 RepID=A0A128F8X3_9GAMM|nr:phage tail protein [Grimontia marina]CZF83222.1 Tail fiber protein [Grimontia marina]
MSQTAIPLGFEQYLQNKVLLGEPTDLNEIIFAYIPDLDVSQTIDRTVTLPPQGQWVHQQDVEQIGKSGSNAVVYSVVIPGSTAPFTFNAMFLHDKAVPDSCAMVVYKATETKETGMALTKSLLMQFDGAAKAANVTVDAATWQVDYQARLKGMDEDHRLHCLDNYGHTAFLDGFEVTQHASDATKYLISPGLAYLGGLRVQAGVLQVLTVTETPVTLWLDAYRDGTATSAWANTADIRLSADPLTDYADGNGRPHYVCPLAMLHDDGTIKDLREVRESSNSCPVGAPLPWPTDEAPEGFAIMKGQAFDKQTYPKTAQAYPLGVLPDMRGMAVVGKKETDTVLAFESDQIKSHGHPNSTVSSTDMGNKYTTVGGNHRHHTRGGYQGGYTSSYHNADAAGGSHGNVLYSSTTGNHNHIINVGSHSHTVNIAAHGGAENTIKNIKFNWIVRLQ